MLSIQQMQYILTLSETKQFQKSSEICFVTQPTLSMQIKKAENMLGYLIFDRSRNPIELTNFGEQLIPILKEILAENLKIELLKQKMSGTYTEQIRMGIIPTVSAYMVPELFGIWQKRVSGVHLMIEELKTEDLLDALENKTIDIGILAGPVTDPKLRNVPLYREEILAYIPELKSTEINPGDLSGLHPWLLNKGNCLRTQMIQFCQLKDQSDDVWNYEGGNLELLLKLVDENGGYTLVPEFYQLESKKRKQLKRITSGQNSYPAREIIALAPNRSIKWQTIEGLIREVQLFYNKYQKENLEILNWN